MSFDTFSEFLTMGGHGLYVWTAYGVALIVFVGNAVAPLIKKKEILNRQAQRIKRESLTI